MPCAFARGAARAGRRRRARSPEARRRRGTVLIDPSVDERVLAADDADRLVALLELFVAAYGRAVHADQAERPGVP
ncbi:hypothetical protein [Cellulomonas alba]|uniref:Uncharacterized protein n=1 Tax=Cellulomonas alba TaxID=3053467 RepID=A0ABT7SG57_9CELL|nr:hypothetical protein [Cellulomonas alba]MDM7855177.1 hypothetical protein [Cellulomonas alba]